MAYIAPRSLEESGSVSTYQH